MDRIERACKEAKKLGISYGKYKALIYEQQLKNGTTPKYGKQKKEPEEIVRRCVICGREIKRGTRRRKYCCFECSEVAAGHISKDSEAWKNR